MKAEDREIIESPLYQGEDESIAYSLTTTPWGSSPTSIVVTAFELDGTDVSSTVLSGSASVTNDVITMPAIVSLTDGKVYRIEVKFTDSDGNIWEPYFYVNGQE